MVVNLAEGFLSRRNACALFLAIIINGLLLLYFHDRFWWPADEGLHAHVAERFLQGEILSKDVQQFHTGYHHWIHAAALKIFGKNLLSLRYPLILIALIQSLLVFFVFRRCGYAVAVIASVVPTALGVLQYLNPNPHWYCQLSVIALVCSLTHQRHNVPSRFVMAGFFAVLTYMFRQLSGIIVIVGTLAYLLFDNQNKPDGRPGRGGVVAKFILGLMLLGLFFYLKRATDISGLLLIGLWPLLILGRLLWTAEVSNKQTWVILKYFLLGGVMAALPMVLYHAAHGSLAYWVDDTFLRVLEYADNPYLHTTRYFSLTSLALKNILAFRDLSFVLNGLYWIVLIALYMISGYLTLRAIVAGQKSGTPLSLAIPFIACFYAVVSLHYQVPIYVYHTVNLTVLGLMWLFYQRHGRVHPAVVGLCVWLCGMGIVYHAAQPLSRGLDGLVQGERVKLVPAHDRLKYVDLWIEEEDIALYSGLVNVIQRESGDKDTLFVLPYDPELYFLADRKNPYPFAMFSQGVSSDRDLREAIKVLDERPPKLIINNIYDKRQTPYTYKFMEQVRKKYQRIRKIDPFEVYKYGNDETIK